MSTRNPRPWYIFDDLCDDYVTVQTNGGDLRMLQVLKVIRGIVLNGIVGTLAFFTITQGADPTVIGVIALVGLMAINGVEASDYLAAKHALEEAKQTSEDD